MMAEHSLRLREMLSLTEGRERKEAADHPDYDIPVYEHYFNDRIEALVEVKRIIRAKITYFRNVIAYLENPQILVTEKLMYYTKIFPKFPIMEETAYRNSDKSVAIILKFYKRIALDYERYQVLMETYLDSPALIDFLIVKCRIEDLFLKEALKKFFMMELEYAKMHRKAGGNRYEVAGLSRSISATLEENFNSERALFSTEIRNLLMPYKSRHFDKIYAYFMNCIVQVETSSYQPMGKVKMAAVLSTEKLIDNYIPMYEKILSRFSQANKKIAQLPEAIQGVLKQDMNEILKLSNISATMRENAGVIFTESFSSEEKKRQGNILGFWYTVLALNFYFMVEAKLEDTLKEIDKEMLRMSNRVSEASVAAAPIAPALVPTAAAVPGNIVSSTAPTPSADGNSAAASAAGAAAAAMAPAGSTLGFERKSWYETSNISAEEMQRRQLKFETTLGAGTNVTGVAAAIGAVGAVVVMDESTKAQLKNLYNNLNPGQKNTLRKLLDKSSSCVNKDVTFAEYLSLIRGSKSPDGVGFIGGLRGSIHKGHATGSHFRINLPNTYQVWRTIESVQGVLSYVDMPSATGGGFKPQDGMHANLGYASRELCIQALQNAGITAERLRAAGIQFDNETARPREGANAGARRS